MPFRQRHEESAQSPSHHGITTKIIATITCVVLVSACDPSQKPPPTEPFPIPTLDSGKRYANPFAPDGTVPVGDGKWSAEAPKQGEVFVCRDFASGLRPDAPGAEKRGPWFVGTDRYRPGAKPHVEGNNPGGGDVAVHPEGSGNAAVYGNGLPNHDVGTFPIDPSSPVYPYDRNPNRIAVNPVTALLDSEQTPSATPRCTGNQIGVLLTGSRLFSAVDARGNDAQAWEVQDSCDGHPEEVGKYHYHGGSPCSAGKAITEVVGVAVDGFPITGGEVRKGEPIASRDLDVCHGIIGPVDLPGGVRKTMYHYVLTPDYPYSVACLRGDRLTAGAPR